MICDARTSPEWFVSLTIMIAIKRCGDVYGYGYAQLVCYEERVVLTQCQMGSSAERRT